jgi:hypothetical protein
VVQFSGSALQIDRLSANPKGQYSAPFHAGEPPGEGVDHGGRGILRPHSTLANPPAKGSIVAGGVKSTPGLMGLSYLCGPQKVTFDNLAYLRWAIPDPRMQYRTPGLLLSVSFPIAPAQDAGIRTFFRSRR